MLISTEKEQISMLSENLVGCLESSPMGSSSDSTDGLPQASDSSDSPHFSSVFTDVNVVPEHEEQELDQAISNLEDEVVGLKLKQRTLHEKRREALNKILDIKGTIRVFCRVRPFLLSTRRRNPDPISVKLEQIWVQSAGSRKEFGFDKVFSHESTQEDVFGEVEPILKSALHGNNVCILAYGQSGTGKTYTMDGSTDQPGIVPRALDEIFHQACLDDSSTTFSMSMLEVYMGSLRDLLAPKPACRAYEAATRCNLNIQTDSKGSVEIEGLTEVELPNVDKAKWWYARGRRVRSTSWTNVNETSSRSHCLTRITITQCGDVPGAQPQVSKLWMVDLGGSERLLKTGASGQTLDEGRAINLSLSSLSDVIAALRRKRGYVPYRNSKLTQILKDSLGDKSKVLMLVHVSPRTEDVAETICSLSFAKRARAVECDKEVSEDLKRQKEKMVEKLGEEMRIIEEEYREVRFQIKKTELLLSEKRKLLPGTCELPKDEAMSLNEDLKETNGTPRTPTKVKKGKISHSLPRFMTSTAASRQRQDAVQRQLTLVAGNTKGPRSVTRSSMHFSASQSISYSDARLKAILQNTNKKKQSQETKIRLTESPKCKDSDTKTASLPRSKMVTSSDPNVRVMLCRHRRRMSNLM